MLAQNTGEASSSSAAMRGHWLPLPGAPGKVVGGVPLQSVKAGIFRLVTCGMLVYAGMLHCHNLPYMPHPRPVSETLKCHVAVIRKHSDKMQA